MTIDDGHIILHSVLLRAECQYINMTDQRLLQNITEVKSPLERFSRSKST